MPKKSSLPKIKEETLPMVSVESIEERVGANLRVINEFPDDTDVIKSIVCKFFQGGKHPDCFGCVQPRELVLDCADEYRRLMRKQPADIYSKELSDVTVREPIPLSSAGRVGLNCDSCYVYDKCPMFKAGHSCGIAWGDAIPSTNEEFVNFLIDSQTIRLRRAMFHEELDGGVPDQTVSSEMDRLKELIKTKADLSSDSLSIRLDAKSGSSQGGILDRIFGSGIKQIDSHD